MLFFPLSVLWFHKELSYSMLGFYDLYSFFQFGNYFLGQFPQFLVPVSISKCATILGIVTAYELGPSHFRVCIMNDALQSDIVIFHEKKEDIILVF